MLIADAAELIGLPSTATEDDVLERIQAARPNPGRINASHGQPGPWGSRHPVAWALSSDRITVTDVGNWVARYANNPAATGAVLASLTPAPDLRAHAGAATVDPAEMAYESLYGPAMGASRPVSAAGYRQPAVDASPALTTDRNAVEELRATHPDLVRAAERGGPPPEMFAGNGDYPALTVSGVDPVLLHSLPWRARLAAAWAPTRAEAARLIEDFSGDAGDVFADESLASNPAVTDYIERVQYWAANSGFGD
jgi:hypothetical protein